MSAESPQFNRHSISGKDNDLENLGEHLLTDDSTIEEVPDIDPRSPGPQAPQLIFEERPILGEEAVSGNESKPRIDLNTETPADGEAVVQPIAPPETPAATTVEKPKTAEHSPVSMKSELASVPAEANPEIEIGTNFNVAQNEPPPVEQAEGLPKTADEVPKTESPNNIEPPAIESVEVKQPEKKKPTLGEKSANKQEKKRGRTKKEKAKANEKQEDSNTSENVEARNAKNQEAREGQEVKKSLVEMFRQKFGVDNAIDSAKIAFSEIVAGWYGSKAAEKRAGVAALHADKKVLETDAKHIAEQLKIFRKDGNISEKTLLKIENDGQRLQDKVRDIEQEINKEQARLEALTINKEAFENKRNQSCQTYIERTRAELRPFEEQISDLSLTRKQLESEIARDQEMLAKRRAELTRLQAVVEAEKFPSLRQANREIMRQIEAEAGAFEKEIREREKMKGYIEKDIRKSEKRAEPLRNKSDELERIMRGKEPEIEEGNNSETINDESVGATTNAEAVKRKSRSHRKESEESEVNEIIPEAEPAYALDELIDSWNDVNRSKMMINPETFKKEIFKTSKRGARSRISVNDFWNQASLYSARFGDQERMAGMPDMKKAANKKGSFWRWLFGLSESRMEKKRLLETVMSNREKKSKSKGPNAKSAKPKGSKT